MITVWATVIKYQDGLTTLYVERNRSCTDCISCVKFQQIMFKKHTSKNLYIIALPNNPHLFPKQRIQIGLPKTRILTIALLFYINPLLSLLIIGTLFEMFFKTDLAAITGVFLGGISGFFLTKYLSILLIRSPLFQPVIIYSSLLPNYCHLSINN
ncbi:SoxR reducing system RseC family protein [Candidatus Erwinia haradaeae]|uniref:Protein RseC, partial n=1 Tax=Candidatus Erwinia haradaeae TaxID=1922217 RepID=A0A803FUG3_9GAMM|nr:SoxR reducing system RseC family protein [Candidatus Erwinia haradaeae]VFP88819.1 Protein RseC [Candidatus Erwinia haradaeae]